MVFPLPSPQQQPLLLTLLVRNNNNNNDDDDDDGDTNRVRCGDVFDHDDDNDGSVQPLEMSRERQSCINVGVVVERGDDGGIRTGTTIRIRFIVVVVLFFLVSQ